MCPLRWLLVYTSALLFGKAYAASWSITSGKRSYCGTRLTRIMAQFCLMYPSPPEHRQKRQIASECCHNKCSLDYLLENYCGTVDTEALEKFKLSQAEEPVETTTPISQIRDRRRYRRYRQRTISEENDIQTSSHTQSHRRARGKRNCTCRKRHRKMKSKSNKHKLQKILSRRRAPLPDARIEPIKSHEEPFYVISSSK